jgi:hypothetical protein
VHHRNALSPFAFTPLASALSIRTLREKKSVGSLFSWVSVILVTLAIIYSSIPASASSNGITGFSGKTGSTCTSCHSTGTPPTVSLSGPTTVASGSTNSYTLTVGGTGNHGLDVAASTGTFTAGTGTKVQNTEITQTSPSSTGSWTFTWTAPTVTANTTATVWAAAVNGFGGGTGAIQQSITVTAPVANPTLNVNPASLGFAFTSGGSTPASQTIAVSSSGSALTYTVSASTTTGGSWLNATGSGSTPGNVTVSINPASLAAGTYTGTVSISSTGASNSPKTVSVTLTVTAAPTLNTSPASLSFSYQAGGTTPSAQSVNVSSSGAALSYTTATSATWLLATPASGSTPGNLSVSVNPAGLAAGTYTGNVTVTSAGASNNPKTVPVTLTVTAAQLPTLNTSPASLTFSYQAGGTTPTAQTVNVSSSGSGLSYTTATSAIWLVATPASGSTPGSLSVSINPTGLAAGTYTGNVTVTSAGASNSPKAIAVTLNVTAASLPMLTASPLSLAFSYQSGGATPAAQNVSLSSSGNALNYTAASSAGWLTVTPGSGTTPGSLSVSVNPTSLAVGTYTGNITVSSAGASNASQKITVSLSVTGAPPSGASFNITPGSLSFTYASGTSTAGTQNLAIASSGTVLQYTATTLGGSWLSISPATGSTPTTMKVSANPTGLAVGTYKGTITITSGSASNSPQTVPVSLVVTSTTSGRLRVWPPRAVTFDYTSGQTSPGAKSIRVLSRGAPLSFTAAAFGGTWLSVTPSGGTTPGALSITVDPAGLASGTYSATVKLTSPGSAGLNVPVVLTVFSAGDGGGEGESEDGGTAGSETALRASPYAYDPTGTNSVAANWLDGTGASAKTTADSREQGLLLSKTSATSVQAQAVVVIQNAEGITLTELGYDIRNGSQCTAKSPHFVVVTSDDVVHKIGCSTGTTQPSPATGWKRLRFDPTNPSQTVPAITPGSKVKSIHIVLVDGPETGASLVVLDNINVNGTFIGKQ